jgi:hypothetical protein
LFDIPTHASPVAKAFERDPGVDDQRELAGVPQLLTSW